MELPQDPDQIERKLAVDTAEMLIYQGRVEALTLVLDDLHQFGDGQNKLYSMFDLRALVKARRDRDRAVLRHLEDQIDG